jgi:hypothetical protein
MSRLDFRRSQHLSSLSPVSRWQRDHEGSRRNAKRKSAPGHTETCSATEVTAASTSKADAVQEPLARSRVPLWRSTDPAAFREGGFAGIGPNIAGNQHRPAGFAGFAGLFERSTRERIVLISPPPIQTNLAAGRAMKQIPQTPQSPQPPNARTSPCPRAGTLCEWLRYDRAWLGRSPSKSRLEPSRACPSAAALPVYHP